MVVGTVVAPPQTGLLKRSLSSCQNLAADADANATAEMKAIAEEEGNRDHASSVEAALRGHRWKGTLGGDEAPMAWRRRQAGSDIDADSQRATAATGNSKQRASSSWSNIHDISNLGERCETSVAGRQDWGHVGAGLAAAGRSAAARDGRRAETHTFF
ncbi:hypothetical protein MKX08_008885 [Trichoderma sp. CBMAI-0020]|nr:hypothetical protein MKX08_008885 [Trichoderma sp. CBMAI-0020]